MLLRRPTILLSLILIFGGCGQRGVQFNFVVPDGYTGVLKIRNQPTGIIAKSSNGVIELSFSTNGVCDVRGEPLKQWHRINPRYATTGSIAWVQFPDQTPTNVIGLRWVGSKHEAAEDWFVIGTLADAAVAHEKMVGFKWPSR